MNEIGQSERTTQDRVAQLLQHQLHYHNLGNWQYAPKRKSPIEQNLVEAFLKRQGHSESIINRVVRKLLDAANMQQRNIYEANKEVYGLLRYGTNIKELGEKAQTIPLIDWKQAENNVFSFAEEVSIEGKEDDARPDIVLYVNGIALAVLELKKASNSVEQGIRQLRRYQKEKCIEHFFTTIQLTLAGNDSQGIRYGTIETTEKYYLQWKEENPIENLLDRHILQLCNKKRFLEIIHDFVVFDRGIKKVCRPNQYFGVKAAQERIRQKEGGIIWHTQGSGKSLTMVWLTKWIKENENDPRVLILTDRTELDEQIEKVFDGVGEQIHRTTNSSDLLNRLNKKDDWLMCSLIHKFGRSEKSTYNNYVKELKATLPKNFSAKGNLFIFVDECHRTQSGKLHDAMKALAGNAMIIGFTGTPLLKKDKKTSIEKFGSYIHTYKFDEAVADGVVLDLKYEARDIDQNTTSKKKIDEWFEAKTKGLTEYAKATLKQRWGTVKKLYSSKSRLEKIVTDIIHDMAIKPRLESNQGNAMLVAGSIYQACKYYELFQNNGLKKCAIVTSYIPNKKQIRDEETGEGKTEKQFIYDTYEKMLGELSPNKFEEKVKKQFIDEPARMKLLIVVDKLLTGFDAPSSTYLYIDKKMQDHGLFQAVCRVNRLDGEDKEFGYVIDYKDLFKVLEKSVHDYTQEAFGDYDAEDIKGLLSDRLETGKKRLEEHLESLKALCEPISPPKDQTATYRFFCGDNSIEALKKNAPKRTKLYKLTSSLLRAYADIASDMEAAGYTVIQTKEIRKEVNYFQKIREEVKLHSGDHIDLKSFEPAMRYLLDTYISAEESQVLSAFDDLTLVEMIVERGIGAATEALPKDIRKNQEAMAETIENNLRKVIVEKKPTNPKYYEKMSKLLEQLTIERRNNAKEYGEYLKLIEELTKRTARPQSDSSYPNSLNTNAKRALYDNLEQDEQLAIVLDEEIRYSKKHGWRGHKIKEKQVKKAIKKHIKDEEKANEIFNIVKEQSEY